MIKGSRTRKYQASVQVLTPTYLQYNHETILLNFLMNWTFEYVGKPIIYNENSFIDNLSLCYHIML